MDELGQTPTSAIPQWTIENELEADCCLQLDLLHYIYMNPQKTKSDLVRAEASYIAALACNGFISTRTEPGMYSDTWRVTKGGLCWLEEEERL